MTDFSKSLSNMSFFLKKKKESKGKIFWFMADYTS